MTRSKMVAYGQIQPMVDAEPVRQHVRALIARHRVGWQTVSHVAGVADTTLSTLLYAHKRRPPSRSVHADIAHKLMNARVTMDTVAPTAPIHSAGTQRRLAALVAAGYTPSDLMARIGWWNTRFPRIMRYPVVLAGNACKVRGLFEELVTVPPPESADKRRALKLAAERGYMPGLAWDDLDDPDETPNITGAEWNGYDHAVVHELVAGRCSRSRLPDRQEAARRLARAGLTTGMIATHLGMNRAAVTAALTRGATDDVAA